MPQHEETIVLQQLFLISAQVTSVAEKIDGLTKQLTDHISEDEDIHKDSELRMQAIEDNHKKVKWMAIGAGSVIAGLWHAAEAVIMSFKH